MTTCVFPFCHEICLFLWPFLWLDTVHAQVSFPKPPPKRHQPRCPWQLLATLCPCRPCRSHKCHTWKLEDICLEWCLSRKDLGRQWWQRNCFRARSPCPTYSCHQGALQGGRLSGGKFLNQIVKKFNPVSRSGCARTGGGWLSWWTTSCPVTGEGSLSTHRFPGFFLLGSTFSHSVSSLSTHRSSRFYHFGPEKSFPGHVPLVFLLGWTLFLILHFPV